MVTDEDYSNVIIKTRLGENTGDVLHQTADGRWWKKWYGETPQTGEEIKSLRS